MSAYEAAVEIREPLATVAEEVGGIRDLLRERLPEATPATLRTLTFCDPDLRALRSSVNRALSNFDAGEVVRVGDALPCWSGHAVAGGVFFTQTIVVRDREAAE